MSAHTNLSRLRSLTGPLIILIAISLGYYILGINYPEVYNGYDGISRALGYYYTLGPALAGYSAWDMSRFRILMAQRQSTNDLWKTVLRRLSAPAALAFLSVLLVMSYYGGLSTSQAWAGTFLAGLQTLLWVFLGTTLSLYVHPLVSLPAAIFIPWFLTGYPGAMSDPTWRQMFGQPIGGCCMVDSMIDPVTIRSSTVTLGLLLAACLILTHIRLKGAPFRASGTVAAVVLVISAVTIGYSLGKSGNFMNSVARSDARICNDHVCFWPESDQTMVDTNLAVAEKLGMPSGVILVDGEARNDNELWMSGESEGSEVEQRLIIQLVARSPELGELESCWVDENGRVLSVADNADAVYYNDELISAATDESGRFLGYSTEQNTAAWTRLAALINHESGCDE